MRGLECLDGQIFINYNRPVLFQDTEQKLQLKEDDPVLSKSRVCSDALLLYIYYKYMSNSNLTSWTKFVFFQL